MQRSPARRRGSTLDISDLTEERRGYANGHPKDQEAMRFLVREQGPVGVVTHSVHPEAFDDLDPESRDKGWGHKVGKLRTMCGWGDITLSDLVPAHAAPLCLDCRALDTFQTRPRYWSPTR